MQAELFLIPFYIVLIISKLSGGLGNQMFQYAIGRHLSVIRSESLRLDLSFFEQASTPGIAKRDFELKVFNFPIVNIAPFTLYRFLPNAEKKKLLRVFFKLINQPKLFKVVDEIHYKVFSAVENVSAKHLYLTGFWQSDEFFKPIESVIRNDFAFTKSPSSLNKDLLDEITNVYTNSVSLHIRRGDYVSDEHTNQYHGICSFEYYKQAIKMITDRVPNPFFYIFSDEPEWVMDNFNLDFQYKIIHHNQGRDSFEDMRLMSNCKHHIIANSSFSWWGAWLNPSPEKIVVCPIHWFAGMRSNQNAKIVPEDWIRI